MIDKEYAAELMAEILECNKELSMLVVESNTYGLSSEQEEQIKRHVGKVMTSLLVTVINPIGIVYPDLYPDALRPKSGKGRTIKEKKNQRRRKTDT